MTPLQKRQLVEMDGSVLPVSTQAELLGLNRKGLYYRHSPPSEESLKIKLHIDKIYTAHPEYGYRRICWWLNNKDGILINHKAVLGHMHEMGIQAIYPRQNTSTPEPGHKIYPYLLKGLKIDHPDHVWSIDITYIPVRTDWLYLVAIIDWFSRYVLSWELSDSLEIGFVLEAAVKALKEASPDIMNSDQGGQFTSEQFTGLFLNSGSKISMDHRGRAHDNIFIERLWRTVKYEDVYLKEYETPREARIGINSFMRYYNHERPHSSLNYLTPEKVYRKK